MQTTPHTLHMGTRAMLDDARLLKPLPGYARDSLARRIRLTRTIGTGFERRYAGWAVHSSAGLVACEYRKQFQSKAGF